MENQGSDDWSSRDLELLCHVAAGESAGLIARRCGLSVDEVRREVRALRVRLASRTNVQAVVAAMHQGLID